MTHLSNQIPNNDLKGLVSHITFDDDYTISDGKERHKREAIKYVKRWCEDHKVKDTDGCVFAITIKPDVEHVRGDFAKRDAVESIVNQFIGKCNSFLWNNPDKFKRRFICGTNVIESHKKKEGTRCPHHHHGIWCIHPLVAHKFNNDLFTNIINRTPSLTCIEEYLVQPIINDPNDIKTSTDGWVDYICAFARYCDDKQDKKEKYFDEGKGRWGIWQTRMKDKYERPSFTRLKKI